MMAPETSQKSPSAVLASLFVSLTIIPWLSSLLLKEEHHGGSRAYRAFNQAFADGILIRVTGDIIALSPPLILNKQHIDELFGKLANVLKNLD